MKRSYLMAGILAAAAAGWVASGQLSGSERTTEASKPPADLSATEHVPTVRVRNQHAQMHTAQVVLRGRTEADRKVQVKAETHGRIVELAVDKGDRINKGDVLLRLSAEDRPARLAEAKALREQRRIEHEAAIRLSKKGFRAETQVAAAKAELESAEYAVTRAEVEIENLVIRAPFSGVVGDRMVEIGDFVEMGDSVVRIVDLDPILAVVQISERDLARVSLGSPGRVRFMIGDGVEGTVSYVATEADPLTRTFTLEVEIPNPDATVPDGITAEVTLPLQQIVAHKVSPAILTLTDGGIVGVKTLGADNTVEFYPVEILGESPDGVWLTGLPERVTLITVGQEFITPGQTVRPIDEGTLEPLGEGETS